MQYWQSFFYFFPSFFFLFFNPVAWLQLKILFISHQEETCSVPIFGVMFLHCHDVYRIVGPE